MEDILVIILLVVMVTAGMVLFFGGWPDLRSTLIVRCAAHKRKRIRPIPQVPRRS